MKNMVWLFRAAFRVVEWSPNTTSSTQLYTRLGVLQELKTRARKNTENIEFSW